MFDAGQINFDSEVGSLPHSCHCVGPETLIVKVSEFVEADPTLPGVLLIDNGVPVSLFSRDRFLELVGGRFGFALYERRAMGEIWDKGTTPWIVASTDKIRSIAERASHREEENVFEPVVIDFGDGRFSLLSANNLFLAQSALLARANEEVRKQKDTADAANEAKSQFLANMSHEIRTPMNGILGITDLLFETDINDEQRNYLRMVKSSADWLITVINDVLDFSKIEANMLSLEEIDFQVRQFLDDTMKPMEFRANEKGLDLIWRVDDDVPRFLNGDPVRLRQMIVNLVGNGIKFTQRGHVTVSINVDQILADALQLHISVQDSGVGIKADRVAKIFDAFEQADGTTTREFGGTGLGLSICKRIAELMGGSVWAESVEGQGSTFHIRVKLRQGSERLDHKPVAEPADTASASTSNDTTSPSLNLLLAEDNIVNQKLAQALLAKRGHLVHTVSDGQQALQAALKSEYDVILMDVQMPILDGMSATQQIRAQWKRDYRVPIIAMTAHAMQGDREKCLAAGMDGYIAKPMRAEDLYAEIDRVWRRSGRDQPAKPHYTPKPIRGVVDWKKSLATTGGHESILLDIAKEFVEDSSRLIVQINSSIHDRNAAGLKISAHSLKSSFGYFGVHAGAAICQRIELRAAEGDCQIEAEILEELRQVRDDTCQELSMFIERRHVSRSHSDSAV